MYMQRIFCHFNTNHIISSLIIKKLDKQIQLEYYIVIELQYVQWTIPNNKSYLQKKCY